MRKYKVIDTVDDDDIDGAREIETYWADDAATIWAQRSDSDGDYTIVRGTSADVTVMDCETGYRTKWRVRGENSPTYYADQVE